MLEKPSATIAVEQPPQRIYSMRGGSEAVERQLGDVEQVRGSQPRAAPNPVGPEARRPVAPTGGRNAI